MENPYLALILSAALSGAGMAARAAGGVENKSGVPRPNILFIVADDLNDYLGCMGGHPQAITPNLDRLAARGVLFANAAANAPTCSPSRASMLYGLYPHTSLHFDVKSPMFYDGPYIKQRLHSWIELYKRSGYAVRGTGKIYHNLTSPPGTWIDGDGNSLFSVPPNWGPYPGDGDMPAIPVNDRTRQYFMQEPFSEMTQMWCIPSLSNSESRRHPKFPPSFGMGVTYAALDEIPRGDGFDGWYLYDRPFRYASEEDRDPMPDEMSVAYVKGLLEKGFDRPFFINVGLVRPHTPLYAPRKYFDRYPLETLELPPGMKKGDIAQIAEDLGRDRAVPKIPYRDHGFRQYDLLMDYKGVEGVREFLQAWLANVSFVDDMVGRILDALDRSPYANNTLIVFTSDHGYHVGEKEQVFKGTVWEETSRVPLIAAGPGVARGEVCIRPVSLVDLYPTFLDYSGLSAHPNGELGGLELDGHSLRPLMVNPQGRWDGPDVSLSVVGNDKDHEHRLLPNPWEQHYSVRSERYRYIRTASGQEELYDLRADPHAWTNLAGSLVHRPVKEDLYRQMKELVTRRESYDVPLSWRKPKER